ncbi:MAG: protein BatD [Saprospiraceae bacterium]|nr:protein BatD [Saprospiraceae bacterium]
MGKAWLSLLIILFVSGLQAQQVQWYAEAPDEVFASGQFEVSFVLTNARGSKLRFPDFNGLEVLAGPNTSNSVSIINGARSSSTSYTLVLRAENQGSMVIGPATIEVEGHIYKTKALTIKVKKGDLSPDTQNGIRAIAKMELSDKKVYVGQQVTARYKLYYNENLAFSDELKHPEFTGFFHKQLGAVNQPVSGMRIGNREYTGMLVDAIALFPQKSGQYAIKPSLFPLRKRSAGEDPFFNPFGNYEDFPIQSNGDDLRVIPLPGIKAEDYIGALGQYSAEVEVKNPRISTDEAVTFYITVTGNGHGQQVEAPRLPMVDGLDIYPAKVAEEQEFVENQQLWHKKTFEYLISASKPGPYVLRPQASFFNPESGKFEPLQFKDIEITVSQGKVREEGGYISSTPVKASPNSFLIAVAGGAGLMLLLFGVSYLCVRKNERSTPIRQRAR